MSSTPELEDIEIDPLAYDLIFIGTPVWAWNISPPIRTFLYKFDFSGKNIAIWMCSSRKTTDTFKKFKALLPRTNIVGQMNYLEPLNNNPDEIKEKVIKWAKSKI